MFAFYFVGIDLASFCQSYCSVSAIYSIKYVRFGTLNIHTFLGTTVTLRITGCYSDSGSDHNSELHWFLKIWWKDALLCLLLIWHIIKYSQDRSLQFPHKKHNNEKCWNVEINEGNMLTRNVMNVFGILFDSGLKRREQVSRAIKESNTNFYGIKMIQTFFNPNEIKNQITAVYNYSSQWHEFDTWLRIWQTNDNVCALFEII